MTARHLLAASLLLLSLARAHAQTHAQTTPPKDVCLMPDDSAPITLEEPAEPTGPHHPPTVYDVCAPGKVCLAMPMEPGHPLEVWKTQQGWSCGYYASPKFGGGPAWVRTAALRPVPFSPHPALSAWLGAWQGATNRVVVRASSTPGALSLNGTAYWQGGAGNTHFGGFHGEATPSGNTLHVVQDPGASDSCTVDLTLYGRYILASDNDRCGALNVRFQGIWRRPAPRRHLR